MAEPVGVQPDVAHDAGVAEHQDLGLAKGSQAQDDLLAGARLGLVPVLGDDWAPRTVGDADRRTTGSRLERYLRGDLEEERPSEAEPRAATDPVDLPDDVGCERFGRGKVARRLVEHGI